MSEKIKPDGSTAMSDMKKKDDLDIIREVIEEEGMRRDIGLLIDQSVAAASAESSWRKTWKGKILLYSTLGLMTAAGVLYFMREEAENASPEASENLSGLNHSSDDQKSDFLNHQSLERVLENEIKISDEAIVETNDKADIIKNLTYQDLGSGLSYGDDPGDDPIILEQSSSEVSNLPSNVDSLENISGRAVQTNMKHSSSEEVLLAGDENTKQNTDRTENLVLSNENVDSDAVKPQEGEIENELIVNTERVDENLEEPITANQESKNKNSQEDSVADNFSLTDDTEGTSTSQLSKEEKKESKKMVREKGHIKAARYDVSVGAGYTFLSTGDIRAVPIELGGGYRINPVFAAKVSGAYGRGTSLEVGEESTYVQAGTQIYFSPFGNYRKNDFRVGAGPTFYQIDQTFLTSSTTIGGVTTREYSSETRNSLGVTFVVENRVMISEVFFVGASLFTHRFNNEDLVSGAQLTVGYKF